MEVSRSAGSSAPPPCPSSTAPAASPRSPKTGRGLLPTCALLPHCQVLPAAPSITAARTRFSNTPIWTRGKRASETVAPSKSLRVGLRMRTEKAGPTLGAQDPRPRSFKGGQLWGQRCGKGGALGSYNAKRKILPLPSSDSTTQEVTRRGGPSPGRGRAGARHVLGRLPAGRAGSNVSTGPPALPGELPACARSSLKPPDTARGDLAIVPRPISPRPPLGSLRFAEPAGRPFLSRLPHSTDQWGPTAEHSNVPDDFPLLVWLSQELPEWCVRSWTGQWYHCSRPDGRCLQFRRFCLVLPRCLKSFPDVPTFLCFPTYAPSWLFWKVYYSQEIVLPLHNAWTCHFYIRCSFHISFLKAGVQASLWSWSSDEKRTHVLYTPNVPEWPRLRSERRARRYFTYLIIFLSFPESCTMIAYR